jgi:hypothetical protein
LGGKAKSLATSLLQGFLHAEKPNNGGKAQYLFYRKIETLGGVRGNGKQHWIGP